MSKIDWRKRYAKLQPGAKVKVIYDQLGMYKKGDIFTLKKKDETYKYIWDVYESIGFVTITDCEVIK